MDEIILCNPSICRYPHLASPKCESENINVTAVGVIHIIHRAPPSMFMPQLSSTYFSKWTYYIYLCYKGLCTSVCKAVSAKETATAFHLESHNCNRRLFRVLFRGVLDLLLSQVCISLCVWVSSTLLNMYIICPGSSANTPSPQWYKARSW